MSQIRECERLSLGAWTRGSRRGEMRVEHYVCICGQSFVPWKDPRTGR